MCFLYINRGGKRRASEIIEDKRKWNTACDAKYIHLNFIRFRIILSQNEAKASLQILFESFLGWYKSVRTTLNYYPPLYHLVAELQDQRRQMTSWLPDRAHQSSYINPLLIHRNAQHKYNAVIYICKSTTSTTIWGTIHAKNYIFSLLI